ncbi:MAG: ABC transporter permease subunit [Longimicrobiales bacterium]
MSTDGHAARGGTVFDIGYQGYNGERRGRHYARDAVYQNGIRSALGLGRSTRAKALPWFFIIALSAIGLIMALIAGGVNRYIGAGTAQALNLPSHSDLYGIASIIMFAFGAVVAPELLCPDRRDGTINLYLVRPITGGDYILARWASFLTVMLVAAWMPQVILFLGLCLSDADPMKYVQTNWRDIPRFLLAGLVISAYVTTLAMLVASFTTRRAYAAVFLIGLFVISTPFTVGLASEMKNVTGQWISMFSLSNIPVHVNDLIFDDVSKITEDSPARRLAPWIRVAWCAGWTAVPGAILWQRYRRMTP